MAQMIPSSLKFSMEGATPSFADNEGQTVEAGSQVRLRIKGIRSELNQMYAIGSIREDYLGYEEATRHEQLVLNTDRRLVLSCSSSFCVTTFIASLMLRIGRAAPFMFVTAVYHNLDFSEALEKLVRVEKNKGEDKYVYVSCQSRYPIETTSVMLNEFRRISICLALQVAMPTCLCFTMPITEYVCHSDRDRHWIILLLRRRVKNDDSLIVSNLDFCPGHHITESIALLNATDISTGIPRNFRTYMPAAATFLRQ